MEDYSEEIEKLEQKLKTLKRKKKENDEMPYNHRLADMIHKLICHSNHTDGCGWHYESWSNIGTTRQRFLDKANEILQITTFTDVEPIIRILNKY